MLWSLYDFPPLELNFRLLTWREQITNVYIQIPPSADSFSCFWTHTSALVHQLLEGNHSLCVAPALWNCHKVTQAGCQSLEKLSDSILQADVLYPFSLFLILCFNCSSCYCCIIWSVSIWGTCANDCSTAPPPQLLLLWRRRRRNCALSIVGYFLPSLTEGLNLKLGLEQPDLWSLNERFSSPSLRLQIEQPFYRFSPSFSVFSLASTADGPWAAFSQEIFFFIPPFGTPTYAEIWAVCDGENTHDHKQVYR